MSEAYKGQSSSLDNHQIKRSASNPEITSSKHSTLRRTRSLFEKFKVYLITKKGNIEIVNVKPAEPNIPEENSQKLMLWRQKNLEILSKNPKRIAYDNADISLAFEAYKTECQCEWETLKNKWNNDPEKLKFLQIINDLRQMVVDEILNTLKIEFPDLEVRNSGSDDLKSDCDLSLKLKNNPGSELKAVDRYRQIFNNLCFGISSAYIFDNNCYAATYSDKINLESEKIKQQENKNIMSFVMFARNAGIEKWNSLKHSILKEIDPNESQEIEKQFTQAEDFVHQFEMLYINEMVKVGLNQSQIFKNSSEVAKLFTKKYPDLSVTALGNLEKEFLEKAQKLILQRNDLNESFEKMCNSHHPSECLEAYLKTKEMTIQALDNQIARLKAKKELLSQEAGRVGEQNPKDAISIRKKSLLINAEIKKLKIKQKTLNEKIPDSFFSSLQEWKRINEEINIVKQESHALKNLNVHLHILEWQKEKLLNALNGKDAQSNIHKVNELMTKISDINHQITKVNHQVKDSKTKDEDLNLKLESLTEQLKNEINSQDKARIENLLETSDALQNAIELDTMIAQCFALEAHVTDSAIGFVVDDIQKQGVNFRSVSEYNQAITELMGFYFAHQMSEHPYEKMIEVSKYVDRLLEACERMKTKAEVEEDIQFPDIDKLKDLKEFFKQLLVLRKDNQLTGAEKQSQVEKLCQQFQMPLKNETVDEEAINDIMQNIHAKLLAWTFKTHLTHQEVHLG